MFYLIVIIGLGIFSLTLFQWKKLTRTVLSETSSKKQFFLYTRVISLWHEWQHYALGNRTVKDIKSVIIAVLMIAVVLILNLSWFKFNSLLLLLILIPAAFIVQIRLGRVLRRRNFEERFPEVLSVVNSAVSAGNSIHQALHRCGKNIEGEFGLLFQRIDRRLNLGEDPNRVFKDAWNDYRYREFYYFNIVMLVSIQLGGQLRVLVGRLSRIITNSRNMALRKAAMTSEARASAKIVAAIPLLFFCGMKYFSPENFDFIIQDATGRIILYYVISSEVIGMAIIWYLVKRAT